MLRRDFLKTGAAVAAAGVPLPARPDVPDHLWSGYDFGSMGLRAERALECGRSRPLCGEAQSSHLQMSRGMRPLSSLE